MLDWKFIIIGLGLAVVLGQFIGTIKDGIFLSFLISGIIVGYLVDNGYKNGAIHGLITGSLGGLIVVILIFATFQILAHFGRNQFLVQFFGNLY